MPHRPEITTFKWVPPFAQGLVRDTRARWAFEELGIAYSVRLLDLGDNKTDAHRALQPFGQIPTYSDGQIEIFESGAIVLHIARQRPGLLGSTPAEEARAVAWMFAALNSVEPMIFDFILVDFFDKDAEWAKLYHPEAAKRLDDRLSEVANTLGDKPWIDGDIFTAGDLLMVSALRALRSTDLVARHPNLAAYVARGEARPAFRKALADHMAVFADVPVPA